MEDKYTRNKGRDQVDSQVKKQEKLKNKNLERYRKKGEVFNTRPVSKIYKMPC